MNKKLGDIGGVRLIRLSLVGSPWNPFGGRGAIKTTCSIEMAMGTVELALLNHAESYCIDISLILLRKRKHAGTTRVEL